MTASRTDSALAAALAQGRAERPIERDENALKTDSFGVNAWNRGSSCRVNLGEINSAAARRTIAEEGPMRRQVLSLVIAVGVGAVSVADGQAVDCANPSLALSCAADQAFYVYAPLWPGDPRFLCGFARNIFLP